MGTWGRWVQAQWPEVTGRGSWYDSHLGLSIKPLVQLECRGTKDSSHTSVTPSVTLTAELNWPIRGKGTQIQVGNKAVARQQDTGDTKKAPDTTILALVTSELPPPHTHTDEVG